MQVPRGGLRVLPAARVSAYVLPAHGGHNRVLAGSHQTLPACLLHVCADWSLWREGEATSVLLTTHFLHGSLFLGRLSVFAPFYFYTNPETLTCDLLSSRSLADIIANVALLS